MPLRSIDIQANVDDSKIEHLRSVIEGVARSTDTLTEAAERAGLSLEDIAERGSTIRSAEIERMAQDLINATRELETRIEAFRTQIDQTIQRGAIPRDMRQQIEAEARDILNMLDARRAAYERETETVKAQIDQQIVDIRRLVREREQLAKAEADSATRAQVETDIESYRRQMEDLQAQRAEYSRASQEDADAIRQLQAEVRRQRQQIQELPEETAETGGGVGGIGGGLAGLLTAAKNVALLGIAYAGLSNITGSIGGGISDATQHLIGLGDLGRRVKDLDQSFFEFKDQLIDTGQELGFTRQETYELALAISDATGAMGRMTGASDELVAMIGEVQGVSRAYGWDAAEGGQRYARAYTLGVTGGAGAQMSARELSEAIAEAVAAGNMRGREGELMDRILSLAETFGERLVGTADVRAVAQLQAQLTATGIEPLRGAEGAQLLQQLNQALMSPGMGEAGQLALYRALNPTGDLSYAEWEYLREEGLTGRSQATGVTNLQAIMEYVNSYFPEDEKTRLMMAANLTGLSMHQYQALEQVFMENGVFRTREFGQLGELFSAEQLGGMQATAIPMAARIAYAESAEELRGLAEELRQLGVETVPGAEELASTDAEGLRIILRDALVGHAGALGEGLFEPLLSKADQYRATLAEIERGWERIGEQLLDTLEVLRQWAIEAQATALEWVERIRRVSATPIGDTTVGQAIADMDIGDVAITGVAVMGARGLVGDIVGAATSTAVQAAQSIAASAPGGTTAVETLTGMLTPANVAQGGLIGFGIGEYWTSMDRMRAIIDLMQSEPPSEWGEEELQQLERLNWYMADKYKKGGYTNEELVEHLWSEFSVAFSQADVFIDPFDTLEFGDPEVERRARAKIRETQSQGVPGLIMKLQEKVGSLWQGLKGTADANEPEPIIAGTRPAYGTAYASELEPVGTDTEPEYETIYITAKQPPAYEFAPNIEQWRDLAKAAGAKYDVNTDLLLSVIEAESSGRPDVISPAGAAGLMQLMPGTARDRGLEVSAKADERLDPEKAVFAGAEHLAQMIEMFEESPEAAIAAYNAGHRGVLDAIHRAEEELGEDLSYHNYAKYAPYLPRETQAYVSDVMDFGDMLPRTTEQIPRDMLQQSVQVRFAPLEVVVRYPDGTTETSVLNLMEEPFAGLFSGPVELGVSH